MKTKNHTGGFTLVELLVVIAIVGILIAMLLPAVQQVREAARRITCGNNIRQTGLALMNYESSHRHLPSGWQTSNPSIPISTPGWGWSATSLPYLEGQNIHDQIDFTKPINDPLHSNIIRTAIPVFLCPSEPAPEIVDLGAPDQAEFLVGRSNYSGVFGSNEMEDGPSRGNGTFFANSNLTISDITDGLSNTIIVGERRNDFGAVSWVGVVPEITDSALRIVGIADHNPNHPDGHFEDFRSYHPAGINVVLGDGSIHFVLNSIAEEVFQALATRDGSDYASITGN